MTPATIAGMAKIIGLDLIALTDHNSCKNCPAIQKAANAYGILFLPGMELTTAEEVHVQCYFPQLTAAMNFDSYVSSHLPHIPNKPALFGEQRICDEEDQILGQENRLLISATDIPYMIWYSSLTALWFLLTLTNQVPVFSEILVLFRKTVAFPVQK